jgi:hypothetical protein
VGPVGISRYCVFVMLITRNVTGAALFSKGRLLQRTWKKMRNTVFAVATVLTTIVGSMGNSAPASASDYPYCLQGRGVGIPGDCSYQS